jgi:hypothetical protein
MLAGIPVSSDLVRELESIVDEPTATALGFALDTGVAVVALTIEDRERILASSTIRQPASRTSAASCSSSTSGGCARGSSSRSLTPSTRSERIGRSRPSARASTRARRLASGPSGGAVGEELGPAPIHRESPPHPGLRSVGR